MATHSSILCLENSMDSGDWWATVHEVTKSQTWLSKLSLSLGFMYITIIRISTNEFIQRVGEKETFRPQ